MEKTHKTKYREVYKTKNKEKLSIEKCIKLTKSMDNLIAGAPSISIIKNRPKEAVSLLKESDIVSMNEEELAALTKEIDPIKGMKILFDWGLNIVNITFGKEGQWLSDGKNIIKTTPPKVFLQDTTGAGDAAMSGILYGILKKKSLKDTAKLAAVLSAMEIEVEGVRVGTPVNLSELEKFIGLHEIKQKIEDF